MYSFVVNLLQFFFTKANVAKILLQQPPFFFVVIIPSLLVKQQIDVPSMLININSVLIIFTHKNQTNFHLKFGIYFTLYITYLNLYILFESQTTVSFKMKRIILSLYLNERLLKRKINEIQYMYSSIRTTSKKEFHSRR